MEQSNGYSFTTTQASAHSAAHSAAPRAATAVYRWPGVAPVNPPSSRSVLQRLHDYLTPPLASMAPTRSQVRSGAYDRLFGTCIADAYRPRRDLLWAYRDCASVIRHHSKSFYFSARLLPDAKRHGIMALYAFCRLSDDLVDEADAQAAHEPRSVRAMAAEALDVWAERNRAVAHEDADPVVAAWADTRQRCSIPAALSDELIEGVRMDLTVGRYESWDDLWVYCYRVASTVGLMSMYITGASTMHAVPYAVQMGVALQLTNILRDVGEDARAGRVYLPQEDLHRFGYTEEMLLSGVINDRFIALMQFQIARARALYDAAWPGVLMLPADSRVAVAAAGTVYRGILDKIEANGYDVFGRRAHLSAREKLRALPGIWWRTRKGSYTETV